MPKLIFLNPTQYIIAIAVSRDLNLNTKDPA